MSNADGSDDHSRHSSLREGLIEHLFVGEIMRELWSRNRRDIEVLRPVTDAAGYDIVIACNGIIRHIQLKTSGTSAKTVVQKVNIALASQPSGCVVWIIINPNTLEIGSYLWFGGQPGTKLPGLGDKFGKHTKGDQHGVKAQRPNIRQLAKGKFTKVANTAVLVDLLFGERQQ